MSYKWDDEEGLVLHYLNSTTAEHILQEVFGIISASTPRYIQFGVKILLETLREMGEAQIKWPREGRNLFVKMYVDEGYMHREGHRRQWWGRSQGYHSR